MHNYVTSPLTMETSTFDPCILISNTKQNFRIFGVQTDDTLILADESFSSLEEKKLVNARFNAKPKEKPTQENSLYFNGCILRLENETITVLQKEQGKKINLVDLHSCDRLQSYVQQRARGAYIASI